MRSHRKCRTRHSCLPPFACAALGFGLTLVCGPQLVSEPAPLFVLTLVSEATELAQHSEDEETAKIREIVGICAVVLKKRENSVGFLQRESTVE